MCVKSSRHDLIPSKYLTEFSDIQVVLKMFTELCRKEHYFLDSRHEERKMLVKLNFKAFSEN